MKNILSHKIKLVPFCLITMSGLLLSSCASATHEKVETSGESNFSFVEKVKTPKNASLKSEAKSRPDGSIDVLESSGRTYTLKQNSENTFENLNTGKKLTKIKEGELLGTSVFTENPYGLVLSSVFIDISDPEVLKENIEETLIPEVKNGKLSLEDLKEVTKNYRSALYGPDYAPEFLESKLAPSEMFQTSLLEVSDLKVTSKYENNDLKEINLINEEVDIKLKW